MATKASTGKGKNPNSLPNRNSGGFGIPVPVVRDSDSVEESQMGFLIGLIAMTVVFCLLLPLLAFLYIDILETKNEAKQQMQQVERLRLEVEQKKDEQ